MIESAIDRYIEQRKRGIMSAKHTIVINGKVYDAVTGLQVVSTRAAVPKTVQEQSKKPVRSATQRTAGHKAASVHAAQQKSTTLRRSHLATPKNTVTPSRTRKRAVVQKSPLVSKFAPHPQPLPRKQGQPIISEMATMTVQRSVSKQPARPTSKEVKERLIAKASAEIAPAKKPVKKNRSSLLKRRLSFKQLALSCLALVFLGAYLAYTSMPGISVSLAGSQAGVAAKYPTYNPDGYSFNGPVSYQPGRVEVSFKSNTGGNGYTISQSTSTWNSAAVLDNLVDKESGGDYQATSEGGVIVYTYGNKAAWSNGGVLYKITSKAPLDHTQLIKIASSM